MLKDAIRTKATIELLDVELSPDNQWVVAYKPWKEVWTNVSIKYFSSKSALYLFEMQWCKDWPALFHVVMRGKRYRPVQAPISEPSLNLIKFHAICD